MKSKRHAPEQVIRKVAEGDQMLNKGATVAEVARSFGITATTWYRWKNTYGGVKATENKRLKKIVADQAPDIGFVGRDRLGKLLTPALSSPMWGSCAPLPEEKLA